jgi:hypothetical protein
MMQIGNALLLSDSNGRPYFILVISLKADTLFWLLLRLRVLLITLPILENLRPT